MSEFKAAVSLPLLRDLRRALAERSNDPFALFTFGCTVIERYPELLDEGIHALEQMVILGADKPFPAIGVSALATAYLRRDGEGTRALQLLENAEEVLPADPDIIGTHVRVLHVLGRFAEERELRQRLLER